MSLPGGGAAKLGGQYEAHWTVVCISEIFRREADSILIEPIGELGVGVEFVLVRGDIREFHQVKRQQSQGEGWSIAHLISAGILDAIKERLQSDVNSRFVFVSSDSARSLRELAERALKANDWETYSRNFLTSNEHRSNFAKLSQHWDLSDEATFDLIKRTNFTTIDPRFLENHVERAIGYFVTEAENAVDVLAELIPREVHQELDHKSIWRHLKARGFNENPWIAHDFTNLIDEATAQYVSSFASETRVGSHYIDRSETVSVLHALLGEGSSRCVVVTGEAGSGKSGILLGAANSARGWGHPALALRVDRLDPANTAHELGTQRGLPGSPAYVLSSIATEDTPALLVIDQLDAVSFYSGRSTELFDPIFRIIEQALANPNIRVLLGCRKFDLEHDTRLKSLTSGDPPAALEISVGRLSVDETLSILGSLGIDTKSLSHSRIELARLPLNLGLIAELSEDPYVQSAQFKTTNDLFNRYWDHKRQRIEVRLNRAVPFKDVLASLTEHMSANQRLSAPIHVLDDFDSRDVSALVSEHVIVQDHQDYGLFHESFFDYAFARTFIANGGDLVSLLLTEGQDLFRRAQVRQVLYYLRSNDRDSYLVTIQHLLSLPDIRAHIRQVVFAVLAGIDEPTLDEWKIIEPIITNSSNTSAGWGIVKEWFSSASWFQMLDRNGVIASWLASNSIDKLSLAVTMLHRVRKQEPDRVAELVSPYVGSSEDWNNALRFLLRGADLEHSRQLFELFLHAATADILDGDEPSSGWGSLAFWDHVEDLLERNPEWAVEAVARYVPELLNKRDPAAYSPAKNHIEDVARKCLFDAAAKVPIETADLLFPTVVRELRRLDGHENNGPVIEIDLRNWFLEDTPDYSAFAETILRIFCLALEHYSTTANEALSSYLEQIQDYDSVPALAVMIEVYKSHPESFADQGATYFLKHLSKIADEFTIRGHWFLNPFLQRVFPYCSPNLLSSLESALLKYHADHEFDSEFHNLPRTEDGTVKLVDPNPFGLPQYILLSAIGHDSLSPKMIKRLMELERKFGSVELTKPIKPQVGSVSSPIPEHAFAHMKPEHFQASIEKYCKDDFIAFRHMVSNQSSQRPAEMIGLFASLRTDLAGLIAVDLVQGLINVDIDLTLAKMILEKIDTVPLQQQAEPVMELLSRHSHLKWPRNVGTKLTQLADVEYEDPNLPRVDRVDENDPRHHPTQVDIEEVNLTNAKLVTAAAALVFADPNRGEWFTELVEKATEASEAGVRAAAAELLTALMISDRENAVRLFYRKLAKDEDVQQSRRMFRFVRYAMVTHYELMSEVIEVLLNSDQPSARWNGARLFALAALRHEDTTLISRELPGPQIEHRLGFASVLASNSAHVKNCNSCSSILSALWNDPLEKVQSEASSFFLNWEQPGPNAEDLIRRFTEPEAFENNSSNLFSGLRHSVSAPPSILHAVETFLELAREKVGDITQAEAGVVHDLLPILLRVYASERDVDTRNRCLDNVDVLVANNAISFEKEIATFDR